MPSSVATFESKNSEGESKSYIAVEDAKGYLALAQFGVVEFHSWGSAMKRPDKPDRIVFDLDPGEGIGWREVVEAAVHIRGELEGLGLMPFVKTSGGKGVHLVVPIVPKLGLPASTPLNWADLESIDAPEDLNYSSLPGLLTTSGDPWAEMDEFARELPAVKAGK